ncbi:MAG: hypothetical protein IPK19_17990 [Chloroflexi bacterium]|nr:hypothetical protein [Chloroflexota bacterium]
MRLTRWIALLGLMVAAFGLIAPVAAQEAPAVQEMPPDPGQFLERCLSAGYSEQECRRLYDELHDSPLEHFAERCLGTGYTTQECRRLYNALFGEDRPLAERCRAAGLTIEECRRLMLAHGNSDLAVRCRAAGLTVEECRRLAGEDPLHRR